MSRIFRAVAGVAAAAVTLSTPVVLAQSASAGSDPRTHYKLYTYEYGAKDRKVPYRWNPCQRINWKINVRAVPRAERDRVIWETKRVLRTVRESSGLRFRFDGKTREMPQVGSSADQRAELLVAFAKQSQTDHDLGRPAGWGGFATKAWYVDGDTDRRVVQIVKGYALIDAPETSDWPTSPRSGGVTRPNIIAHEVGHALGLQHVADRAQIMSDTITRTAPALFGVGDRRGLWQVGEKRGCLSYPG